MKKQSVILVYLIWIFFQIFNLSICPINQENQCPNKIYSKENSDGLLEEIIRKIERNFIEVNKRFDGFTEGLTEVNKRLDGLTEDNKRLTEGLTEVNKRLTEGLTEVNNKLNDMSGTINKIESKLNQVEEILNEPGLSQNLAKEISLTVETTIAKGSAAKINYENSKWITTNKHVLFKKYELLFKTGHNAKNSELCRKKIVTIKDRYDNLLEVDENQIYAHQNLDLLIVKVKNQQSTGVFADISDKDLKEFDIINGYYFNNSKYYASLGYVRKVKKDGNLMSNTPGYGGWSGSPIVKDQKLVAIHKGQAYPESEEYEIRNLFDSTDDLKETNTYVIENDVNKDDDIDDDYDYYTDEISLKKKTNECAKYCEIALSDAVDSLCLKKPKSKCINAKYEILECMKCREEINRINNRNPLSQIISTFRINEIKLDKSNYVDITNIPLCK